MPLGLRLLRVVDVTVDTTRIALATCAGTVLLLHVSLHCVVATVELFRTQGLGEGDCWKVEG